LWYTICMSYKENRNVDVAPGLKEQLARVDASKLPTETPRSRLLADIEAAKLDFQKDPEKHAAAIEKLQDLAEALADNSYNDPNAEAEVLKETQGDLRKIQSEAVVAVPVRGGNGSEAAPPAEPEATVAPEATETESQRLGRELTQTIESVIARIASSDDEVKKKRLEKELELLRLYQKVKPLDRNETWNKRVQEAFSRIQAIERPKKVSSKRAGPKAKAGPQVEVVAKERPEADQEARIVALAQELRAEREAGGLEANKDLDARILAAGMFPFTSEADKIAAEYDAERARLQIQKEVEATRVSQRAEVAPSAPEAVAKPERVESLPESAPEIVSQAQEALRIIKTKLGTRMNTSITKEVGITLSRAQARLERATSEAMNIRHVARIRAVTKKLQALADGFKSGEYKKWEKAVGGLSNELDVALTVALSAESDSAPVAQVEQSTEKTIEVPKVAEREPYITEEESDPVRAAALYTIDKLKSYEELQTAEDGTPLSAPEERQARFKELVKKYWTEFTVHGTYGKADPSTGTPSVDRWTDIDGSACLFLLKEAGIEIPSNSVSYVAQGKTSESGVVLDTSNTLGVTADKRGERLTFDHHNPYASRDISASKLLYETLSNPEIGVLEKQPWLDAMVEYITKEDNKAFTDKEAQELFENFGSNFASLSRNLDVEQMKKFFTEQAKTGYTPYEALPDEYLKQFTFIRNPLRNENQRQAFEKVHERWERSKKESVEAIKKIEEAGQQVFDTGERRYGKVLIDFGKKDASGKWQRSVPMDFDAVRASGYGAYLVWLPESKQFFLKSAKRIDFDLPDGYNVRGHYILKGNPTTELRVTLEEIKAKLAGPAESVGSEAIGVGSLARAEKVEFDPEQGIGTPAESKPAAEPERREPANRKEEIEMQLQKLEIQGMQVLKDGNWGEFGNIRKQYRALQKEYNNL